MAEQISRQLIEEEEEAQKAAKAKEAKRLAKQERKRYMHPRRTADR